MDIEDRLELLKKERPSRRRADSITETWRKMDKRRDLSTKEKLERLLSLTRTEKGPKAGASRSEPQPKPPFQVFENHYRLQSRYGRIALSSGLAISGEILALLSRDSAFSERDLSTALFLDLETTGLSGGAGVVPFLVGLGYYREGQFHLQQFFLGELAEEESMLLELGRFFARTHFRSLVTFNGKAFDLPLLETRFTLHRAAFPLSGLPHLDFLFSARSLWSHKQESCRLYHLAREILTAEREEDIPSAEIPVRYFEYLRTGDFSLIEPVLYHNQEDLLSLLGVVIVGAGFLSEATGGEAETEADAMDLFGAAKILEKAGAMEKSVRLIHRALEGRLSEEVELQAKERLARHFKKNREWDKAISLWQQMTPRHSLSCFRELAVHYEHREKDYAKAAAVAAEGLGLASGVSRSYEEDFSHRLERLRGKISRREGDGGRR
jgi:hypothetical protein